MEYKIAEYEMGSKTPEIEVAFKGNAETKGELMAKAVEFLISSADLKDTFNEDYEKYNKFIDQVLLAIADKIGHEHYYYDAIPKGEHKYNEYDELIVPMEIRLTLLESIVEGMKKSLVESKE